MSPEHLKPRWNVAETDRGAATAMARAAGVPPLVAQLLLLRGIDTPEAAERFLRPRLADLCDPMLLTGMGEAVERISLARDRGEKVLVFGDYDVDGIAATALLSRALLRFGVGEVGCGMPDRLREGFGLMPDQVERAAADGVNLIITVDNGISAFAAAGRATELGVDLIITDHHNIEDQLPPAAAVVNPRREAAGHPAGALCGAGVAFKMATALNGAPNDLDIAALGTVADMVPLLGENRVIVALGLRHMSRHRRVGLAKLADVSGITLDGISSEKIGFQLGPRINAAGRLDDARVALDLLLTDCPDTAGGIAKLLNTANEERRAIEKQIFDEAVEELDAFLKREQRSIVVSRRGWHPGVIGIVASRLYGRYHRPVVILSVDDDGMARGSARSGPGFDMMAALTECREHFTKFGGHKAAAGMSLPAAGIPGFSADFERAARTQLGPDPPAPLVEIDAIASLGELDGALLKTLEALEPHGQGNPSPLFAACGVEIVPQSVKVFKDLHVKMAVRQGGATLSAIWFKNAERFFTENYPARVDIAFTPQHGTHITDTAVHLRLHDIRAAE